jgi:formyltetrahydrofolate hydrolase
VNSGKLIRATSHSIYVIEALKDGPIIAQDAARISATRCGPLALGEAAEHGNPALKSRLAKRVKP